jgi:hypothetical protein
VDIGNEKLCFCFDCQRALTATRSKVRLGMIHAIYEPIVRKVLYNTGVRGKTDTIGNTSTTFATQDGKLKLGYFVDEYVYDIYENLKKNSFKSFQIWEENMKPVYVGQLPQQEQDDIAVLIAKNLKLMGYPEQEIEESVKVALCSKITDIQETLNWEENECDWGFGNEAQSDNI